MNPILAAKMLHSNHKKIRKLNTIKTMLFVNNRLISNARKPRFYSITLTKKSFTTWWHVSAYHEIVSIPNQSTFGQWDIKIWPDLFWRQSKWSAPKAVHIRSLSPMKMSNIPLITWIKAMILYSSSEVITMEMTNILK